MQFFSPGQYQNKCEISYRYYREMILSLLPEARVEHIGASSIPNAISKGDLDIFLGVDSNNLERAVRLLKNQGFQEKNNSLRTSEICMLESLKYDVAFQIVANDSEFEFFLHFRDILRSGPFLVEKYNQLKISCKGWDQEAYRQKKSNFIESVLAKYR